MAKRTHLTHLTQVAFILNDRTGHIEIIGHPDSPVIASNPTFLKACLNIPKLVQALEMLHDLTWDNRDTFAHSFTKKLIDDLTP